MENDTELNALILWNFKLFELWAYSIEVQMKKRTF